MNKKLTFLIAFLALVSLSFISCSETLEDNKFTIKNYTEYPIIFNFRAEEITILGGGELVLRDIPKGTYTYGTIFGIPENVTAETEGDVAGEITFNLGTKALLIFIASTEGGTYTLYATLTVSDDLKSTGLVDPLDTP